MGRGTSFVLMIVITNPFDSRLQGCEFDCFMGMQGCEAYWVAFENDMSVLIGKQKLAQLINEVIIRILSASHCPCGYLKLLESFGNSICTY